MSPDAQPPNWNILDSPSGKEIRLRGDWSLLAVSHAGRKLNQGLDQLSEVRQAVWNLEHIRLLDSAGALLLWRAWGSRYPARLRLRDDQRSWFRQLEDLPTEAPPRLRPGWEALVGLGAGISRLFTDAGGILLLLGQVLVDILYCLRHPRALPWREISATIYRAGAESVLLLTFIGILVGLVLAYQMAAQLEKFGANTAIVGVVGLAFLRELGPFLTALILVGRSGSAFTAGIGAMRVTEEIDALRAFGVSPTLRIVLPRVIGLTLAMPLLVIWTDFSGMLGAVYVSQHALDVGYRVWLNQFPSAVPWENYFIGLAKGVLFGGLIGLVSSYYGLKVLPDTRSLTEYTTRSVVVGIALVIAIDGLLGVALSPVGLG